VDENQISGDWFSLQFENDSALMLFQLREQDIRVSSSRTSILPLVSEKSFG
jgi:predicted secreted hydrolase